MPVMGSRLAGPAQSILTAATVLLVLGAPAPLGAAPPAPQGKGAGADAAGPYAQRLASGDEGAIRAALDEVRIEGKGAGSAVAPIVELLKAGVPTSLAQAALETLGDMEATSAGPAVVLYASHRSAAVRRAALRTLVQIRGDGAAKALRKGLADADAGVRGVAASGLGSLRAKEAVPDLVRALERRVPEAAAALGQLCGAADCERLVSKLGVLPFDVMTSGLDPLLFRPTGDVPDEVKLKVLGRVRELGTPEANRFLRDVQKRWPKNGSAKVKQTLDQAVTATGGGS